VTITDGETAYESHRSEWFLACKQLAYRKLHSIWVSYLDITSSVP